jgi:hypothetical protein
MGASFQFHHPKDVQACYRPQRGQRSVDRHKECPSLWVHCLWGCFIICKIMVSFDVAQDREPVERPFHDLWIHGCETEKRPPYPHRVIKPAKIMEDISGTRHCKQPGIFACSKFMLQRLNFSCSWIIDTQSPLYYDSSPKRLVLIKSR